MTEARIPPNEPRGPLSRERILRAAMSVADEGGLTALTMRKIANQLGVEAMSLYHHVRNKDEVQGGLIDLVFSEIELPVIGSDWKPAMRRRANSARSVLSRHGWAIGILDSRVNPGPATLRHHNAVIGTLREAGFSIGMAAHAYSILDSYIYGFVLQELSMPFGSMEELEEVAEAMLQHFPVEQYPYLAEMFGYALTPDYSYGTEFAFGLELILDEIEGLRTLDVVPEGKG